ncbi:MAG: hypothetical protein QOH21_1376 [Acidobacteriota bacterium]|nr:hypothetical protein [Acidobacteriota bacterium]
MRANRRAWLIFILGLALATWARLLLVDHLADQGWFAKYVLFADQILAGHPPRSRIGDVSPAYLWLTVLLRACGLEFHAIRTLQIVMTSLAALACAAAAKRFGGWIAAIATAVLLLGSRAVLVNATELEPETLILLFVSCAIAALTWRRYTLAGLFLGLTIVTRPAAAVTLLFLAAWLFWISRRDAAAFVGAALLPVIVIVAVNYRLAGQPIIMSPGTVFYEAHNPLSTGAAGVMPRIVAEMNARSPEPDYLHVAYRIVAARATGQPVDPRVSNRYWSGKAFAFLRTYPGAALRLFAWKAVFIVHHYDVYDLMTMKRKADELARWPALPYGLAFILAVAALVLRTDRRELLPVALFAAASIVALLLVNVSARQRNALVPSLAVLGGIAVTQLVTMARARNERVLYAFAAIVIATPLLGIEGAPMREDAYNWWATLTSNRLEAAARAAQTRGDRDRAIQLAAAASILDTGGRPLVAPAALRAEAIATAERTAAPERLFDVAIALQRTGAWREADAILRLIDDYHPLRENRAVSSVAYYRARGALRLRAPHFRALLDRAAHDAPGDAHVLALRAVTIDPGAAKTLDALHDPFTANAALAEARALSH